MITHSEAINKYISNHSDKEEEILHELYRETHKKVLHPRMLSGPILGKFLEMIVKMIQPDHILEIGTYTGYGTICMARGLKKNGILHTIEINDELEEFITCYLKRSGEISKVRLHIGDALSIIPAIDTSFDLCFIDGDKREYPEYLKLCKKHLNSGGFILADNTLWDGKILSPPDKADKHTKGIQQFNEMIKDDPELSNVILPVRDGLTIVQKQ